MIALSLETSYLTSGAYEEAMKKEQAKVKELEDKYNSKILENGVRLLLRMLEENGKINSRIQHET